MKPYPQYKVTQYSLFVALQRIWIRCQSLTELLFRFSPRLLNLVIFRTLSKQFNVKTITATGTFGELVGSPFDVAMFGEYLSTGTFSPRTLTYMLDFFNRHGSQGTFIDVGGHIGLMSIPIARSGDILCHTYEPDARNFNYLNQNIELSGTKEKVNTYNLAVFDQETTIEFEVAEWHHGDHRIRNSDGKTDTEQTYAPFMEDTRSVVQVDTIMLDKHQSNLDVKSPLVVKIDTQGAESHVFRGGQSVLAKADLLVTEFCPYMIKRMNGDIDEMLSFIENNFSKGYVSAKHNSKDTIELEDIQQVVSFLRDFVAIAKLDFVDIILEK